MRYPHYNFKTEYNTTAGYFYGDKTSYGYHEGIDVNDNQGGDSDLGKPIIAMCDGEVTSIHNHATNFGNHLHYKIIGPWGERWVHHAHCNEIYVKVGDLVKEGQLIATIGKSGTKYAHDHWAIKKQPTGIDAIANTEEELKMWENPVEFVEKWISAEIAQPISQEPSIFLKTAVIESYVGILGITPSDDELKSRMEQLEGGAILHDIISQILNQDGRSPLVKLQEEMLLLKNNNETLTRVNRELMETIEIYKNKTTTTTSSNSEKPVKPVFTADEEESGSNSKADTFVTNWITSVIDRIKQLFK